MSQLEHMKMVRNDIVCVITTNVQITKIVNIEINLE